MQIIKLEQWKLYGKYPYYEYLFKSAETNNKLQGMFDTLEAQVPGSVYKDLVNAGIISDPYYERQSLDCEWVANRWWTYECSFSRPTAEKSNRIFLCFDGIDNLASVFLNNELLVKTEGANNPFKLEITELVKEENSLKVVIEAEQQDLSQINVTSELNSQKPRFGYKWDFCRRLVNVGIYAPVYLYITDQISIEEVYVKPSITEIDRERGNVQGQIYVKLNMPRKIGYGVRLSVGEKDNKIFESFTEFRGKKNIRLSFSLKNVKLWYPNGQGAHPLYRISLEIIRNGEKSDEFKMEYGFADIKFQKNENSDKKSLPYLCTVNGRKTYLKGFNFVPMDLMYGTESDDKLRKLFELTQQCNANLLRIWGGGLIASRKIYEEACRRGIMIWQDFLQSGSGFDNIPNKRTDFLKKLKNTSEKAIKNCRNYVCLAAWGGGNELYDKNHRPITYKNRNIGMLKRLVKKFDKSRMFFPSSPSGPNYFFDRNNMQGNHDIHGFYKYITDKDGNHYKLNNESNSLLNSEFSVDSVSCVETLKSILNSANLTVTDSIRNISWRHLGDWWNTLDRDESIFGKFDNLEDYIYASQYIQAEGLRYEIEANRRRAFRNSGSIIWQLNEPCPNVSGTNVIDYYNRPKAAYEKIKRAFSPVLISVRYQDFVLDKDYAELNFFITNDTNEIVNYEVAVFIDDKLETSFKGSSKIADGYSEEIKTVKIDSAIDKGLTIEMSANGYFNRVILLRRKAGVCDLGYLKKHDLPNFLFAELQRGNAVEFTENLGKKAMTVVAQKAGDGNDLHIGMLK